MPNNDRRQQQRTALTVQLVQGQDDDLINWLQRLPTGSRQQVIKRLLRAALKLPEADARDTTTQRLDALDDYTRQIAEWAEEQLKVQAELIASLRRELANRPVIVGGEQQGLEQQERRERLSDEKLERRAKRVDKSSW